MCSHVVWSSSFYFVLMCFHAFLVCIELSYLLWFAMPSSDLFLYVTNCLGLFHVLWFALFGLVRVGLVCPDVYLFGLMCCNLVDLCWFARCCSGLRSFVMFSSELFYSFPSAYFFTSLVLIWFDLVWLALTWLSLFDLFYSWWCRHAVMVCLHLGWFVLMCSCLFSFARFVFCLSCSGLLWFPCGLSYVVLVCVRFFCFVLVCIFVLGCSVCFDWLCVLWIVCRLSCSDSLSCALVCFVFVYFLWFVLSCSTLFSYVSICYVCADLLYLYWFDMFSCVIVCFDLLYLFWIVKRVLMCFNCFGQICIFVCFVFVVYVLFWCVLFLLLRLLILLGFAIMCFAPIRSRLLWLVFMWFASFWFVPCVVICLAFFCFVFIC